MPASDGPEAPQAGAGPPHGCVRRPPALGALLAESSVPSETRHWEALWPRVGGPRAQPCTAPAGAGGYRAGIW